MKTIISLPQLPVPDVLSERPLSELFDAMFTGNLPRGQFAVITYTVEARASKPYRDALKTLTINVTLGGCYEDIVNGRLTREEMEAEFIAQPRLWGKRFNFFLVTHEGNFYLTYSGNEVLHGPEYHWQDGSPIAKEDIAPFLPKKKESPQGGQTKKVIYRDLGWNGITRVAAFGNVYKA